jgi:alpha-tubulin suppressor-like RCC1 family protein
MVWGSNDCHVLGLGTRVSGRKRPFPVASIDADAPSGLKRLLPQCTQVVASGVHSLAVSVDGALHSWWGRRESRWSLLSVRYFITSFLGFRIKGLLGLWV